jgi:hypothetical protein
MTITLMLRCQTSCNTYTQGHTYVYTSLYMYTFFIYVYHRCYVNLPCRRTRRPPTRSPSTWRCRPSCLFMFSERKGTQDRKGLGAGKKREREADWQGEARRKESRQLNVDHPPCCGSIQLRMQCRLAFRPTGNMFTWEAFQPTGNVHIYSNIHILCDVPMLSGYCATCTSGKAPPSLKSSAVRGTKFWRWP